MRSLLIAAAALAFGVSCSSGRLCNTGDTRTCVGPAQCSGGQSCLADGTGYTACDCGGAGGGSAGGGTAGGGAAGGTAGGTAGGAAGGTAGGAGGGAAGGAAGGTVAATHQGTVSFLDLFALDGTGAVIANGGSIDIHFRPIAAPLATCSGTGTAPCQLGVAGVDTCVTVVDAVTATPASTLDVGALTVAKQPDPAPADGGPGMGDSASAVAIPSCQVTTNRYECLAFAGTGGTVMPTGGANGTFTGFTGSIGSATAVERGDWLVVATASVLSSYPILSADAGTMSLLTFSLATNQTAIQWRAVAGFGPVPSALNAPGLLAQDELLQVSYPGGPTPDGGNFPQQTSRAVSVGDTFTLAAPALTFLSGLDDRSDVAALTSDVTLGCASCGPSGLRGSSGTELVLELTTATERVTTTCRNMNNAVSVTVPASHLAFHRARSAAFTTSRAVLSRPFVVVDAPPAPAQPVRFSAGHGFTVRFDSSNIVP